MTAAATSTPTLRSASRYRRPATPRCPRTTSSGDRQGTGEGDDAAAIESILYEGYGPGGAAILVEALSDNRNRTGSEVRHAFDSNGGSLGEPNSVAWQFDKRGVILVDGERYGEDDLMVAIDAGAEDVAVDGDVLKVITEAADVAAVRGALEGEGIDVESSELSMEPKNTVEVGEADASALLRLMDLLEEHDDVDSVHANFDIPEAVLERAAG